ncbi:hypothetical protein B0H14DRAFT_3022268, partial [Mycena olivaceomarginata]
HHLHTSAPATAVLHRTLGPRCLLTLTLSTMQASHEMRFVAPVCCVCPPLRSCARCGTPLPRFPLPHSTSPVHHVTCTCSACWRVGTLLLRCAYVTHDAA